MRLLEEAYHILSDYHSAHDLKQVPIKVVHLRDIIVKRGYVDSILWEKVDIASQRILGSARFIPPPYAAPGDHVKIHYVNLENDWERMVLCKELCHAVLDEESDRVLSADQFVAHMKALAANLTPTAPLRSEFAAEALAIELLFPLELRESYVKAYAAGDITVRQLALRYWIPDLYAEMAMMDDFLEMSRQCRNGKLVQI